MCSDEWCEWSADHRVCPLCVCVCVSQPEDGVCVPEAHVVMQMTVDDVITLIHSQIQVGGGGNINRVTDLAVLK